MKDLFLIYSSQNRYHPKNQRHIVNRLINQYLTLF